MISCESIDFLKDIDDKLNLTVDLDKILTLGDMKSRGTKSSQTEIEPEISETEFSDFICGVPKKATSSFPQSDIMFGDNSFFFDRKIRPDRQNFLTEIREKLVIMIQKEERMQDEIRKLLNNE